MHIFIFHRDLRLIDNTSLIYQLKHHESVIPIFIFPPEQINPKKNKYFSNNSVQFMIESLHELSDNIKDYNGSMYYFKGDNIKVLKAIHKLINIESISFNIDYTPYARQRDNEIKNFCEKNNILCYMKEDYLLYDILDNQTVKANGDPYQVFTPFKKFCMSNLTVRKPDKFKLFKFKKVSELHKIKYYTNNIDNFYELNENINVRGGRKNGLKILFKIEKFKDYNKERDYLTYNTTFLGAYNHFTPISIRETYDAVLEKLGKNAGIINELHWRDFYCNITWFFPNILHGQIGNKNKSFKEKYDKIKWEKNKNLFNKWCLGQTGFPVIDAGMRQLNETGFMHNRVRMLQGNFITKDLHINWREGEKYFATKLVDYSPMQNSGGWQWCAGCGTDAQPYFRIFNPWTQTKDYDSECEYIKKWVPELSHVPNKDIINWYKPEIHEKWLEQDIKYYIPILEHDIERKKTLDYYKQII
jgi:deoxyribodipyrimidine photo-lyase